MKPSFNENPNSKIEKAAREIGEEFEAKKLNAQASVNEWVKRAPQEKKEINLKERLKGLHEETLRRAKVSGEMKQFKTKLAVDSLEYLIEKGIIKENLPVNLDELKGQLRDNVDKSTGQHLDIEAEAAMTKAIYALSYLKDNHLLPLHQNAAELLAQLKEQLAKRKP